MPKLSALFHYPIKSCAGWPETDLVIGDRGPENDRIFMITDEDYHFRTQRKNNNGSPKMALVQPSLSKQGDTLILDAGNSRCELKVTERSDVTKVAQVFDDQYAAIDQGDTVAEYLTNFLGMPCRLVRMEPQFYRRVDEAYSPEKVQTGFADGFPVLLISDASLADLNKRLKEKGCEPVGRENFRAAFWVDGCEPYEEDTWRCIKINGIEFDVVKPCARCEITQVDWRKGEYRADKEPLVTLGQYRHGEKLGFKLSGVMFGQNLVHRGTGKVSVGDEVEVIKRVVSTRSFVQIAAIQGHNMNDVYAQGGMLGDPIVVGEYQKLLFVVSASTFHEAAMVLIADGNLRHTKVHNIDRYVQKSLLRSEKRKRLLGDSF